MNHWKHLVLLVIIVFMVYNPSASRSQSRSQSPGVGTNSSLHARELLKTQMRGAVVEMSWTKTEDPPWDGRYFPTSQSFQKLRDLGANVVILNVQYTWTLDPPYRPVEAEFDLLEQALNTVAQVKGLRVIVGIRNGPGRNEMMPDYEDGHELEAIYVREDAQAAYVRMMADVVSRFNKRPEIVAWEPMIEPTPHTYFGDESAWKEGASPYWPKGMDWWNRLASRLIRAIRKVDPNRPIVIEPVFWGGAEGFIGWKPFNDDNIIYSLHHYEPHEYTHQTGRNMVGYPYNSHMEEARIDRKWLESYLKPVDAFQKAYDVPILVGEWGLMRWVPNAREYITDQIALFEARGWSWVVYSWADEVWDYSGFELILGPNEANVTPDYNNAVFEPIRKAWQKNTH